MLAAAADAQRGRKQYKPVIKGDLALPGGPSWSALRRHVVAAGSQAGLPTLDSIILVEGDQDQRAVARAVNAPVRGTWLGLVHAALDSIAVLLMLV
jgi:hypothetical protein